jgi:selenide, water dikinase
MEKERLTQFSPGAGCGCKISPSDLEDILKESSNTFTDARLLVGNSSKDDAAVYDIGGNKAVISTTDFFTPIVDDPFLFGNIAAVNAMSDIYAMGGKPIMAISILGWPLDKLSKESAALVLDGAIHACSIANIPLAGGHSIDIPVPIFGLAVTGIVNKEHIKRNNTAQEGHRIFLSKALGTGILSTAAKKSVISKIHLEASIKVMSELNSIGAELGKLSGVSAMTDVTGFGLLGHLIEMCEGSNLSAEVRFNDIPLIMGVEEYLRQRTIPGGTYRNWKSYESKISMLTDDQKLILSDPQTSGGLLIAISEDQVMTLTRLAEASGIAIYDIGRFCGTGDNDFLIHII